MAYRKRKRAYKPRPKVDPPGTIPLNTDYPLTLQQQAVVDQAYEITQALLSGDNGKALRVIARAGTGKTHVLVHVAHMIARKEPNLQGKLLVFGRDNADSTTPKMPGGGNWYASTKHAEGFAVYRKNHAGGKFDVQDGKYKTKKYKKLIMNIAAFDPNEPGLDKVEKGERYDAIRNGVKLIEFIRSSNIDWRKPDQLDAICFRHGLTMDDDVREILYNEIEGLMDRGIRMCEQGAIDYTDMYWYPMYRRMKFPTCHLLLADEAQDFNRADFRFLNLARTGNNIIFVGDPFQAIMLFAGAMPDSMDQIGKLFKATDLKLTENFRCAKAVIRHAQKYVPDIVAWEGAIEGLVKEIPLASDLEQFEGGDALIFRRKAQQVAPAYNLIKQGRPAYIKGADIEEEVMDDYDRTMGVLEEMRLPITIDNFKSASMDLQEQMVEALQGRKYVSQTAIEAVTDRMGMLRAFADGTNRVEMIPNNVSEMFKDPGNAICCLTGHKSKGGEWKRVGVFDADNFKIQRKDSTPEDLMAERNLEYVVLTRAMEEEYLMLKDFEEEEPEEVPVTNETREDHFADVFGE